MVRSLSNYLFLEQLITCALITTSPNGGEPVLLLRIPSDHVSGFVCHDATHFVHAMLSLSPAHHKDCYNYHFHISTLVAGTSKSPSKLGANYSSIPAIDAHQRTCTSYCFHIGDHNTECRQDRQVHRKNLLAPPQLKKPRLSVNL
jgi:hypothetical protein